MINGKFVIPPNLSDALQYFGRDLMAQLRVALPGQIQTYDAAKMTCTVQVSYNRVYNDGREVTINAPLVDVPVTTIQGGGVHARFPIQPNDSCWVFFTDINLDAWHAGDGGPATPLDRRRHDIADGFALVGPNPIGKPLVTFLEDSEGGISSATAKVAIDKDTGLITIANGSDTLKAIINDAITQVVNVNTAIVADTSTASAIIPATIAAATAANVQLALILTRLAALLY